jgi:hypothetical protein
VKGPGRPQHPVTAEDCRRWLAEELEDLTRRYHDKLEQVRRAEDACDIVEEVAAIYADVGSGRLDPEVQASRIDLAFMRRNIVLEPQVLAEMDAPKMMVIDEGGAVRFAMRVVTRATSVTRYAIVAQRNRRSRERRTIVDTLVPREADEEEHRCA